MAIYRTSKDEKPFVMLDKTSLEDPRLSFAAKGLHAYLMSKPNNWTPRMSQLIKACTNGRDYIRAAMKNLEETGYVWKRHIKDDKGRFKDWEYVIFETPKTENPFLEEPETEKPKLEKPELENPSFNNNYKDNNNDFNNIPPIAPQKNDDDGYEEFTGIHPAGTQGKVEGRKNWDLCLKDGWSREDLLSAARRYAHYVQMREEMGDDVAIKWPQGFLNPRKKYFEPWIQGRKNDIYERTLARYNKRKLGDIRKGMAPVSDFSKIKTGVWNG